MVDRYADGGPSQIFSHPEVRFIPPKRRERYVVASRSKTVGALIGLALDGQELPLDVSRYLLASIEREEAINVARAAVLRSDRGRNLDPEYVDTVFASVPTSAVETVKKS